MFIQIVEDLSVAITTIISKHLDEETPDTVFLLIDEFCEQGFVIDPNIERIIQRVNSRAHYLTPNQPTLNKVKNGRYNRQFVTQSLLFLKISYLGNAY